MKGLKERAQKGVALGLFTKLFTQPLQFIFGLILARLLTPQDYGLVGMLAIFIALSEVFIDSGFGTALMQKKNPDSKDYSTIFWFNLGISVLVYILLFFSSSSIARFYDDHRLVLLTRVLSVVIVINAFGSIQGKYLNKTMQYGKITKIYIVAFLFSSLTAIVLAALGFGVWALVGKSIMLAIFLNGGWWLLSGWKPLRIFSRTSFKSLGSYGSRVLATSLFNSVFSNIYSLIIGKLFNASSLGYFTRARQFYDLPDKSIRASSMNVFFPALSSMQDDNERLIRTYLKIIAMYAFVLFPIYMILGILARPIILIILTDKWSASIELLQYFCLVALSLPFQSVNENVLYIKGRSDYAFYTTVIRKVFLVILLVFLSRIGLKGMVLSFVIEGYLGGFISYVFVRKILDLNLLQQVKVTIPAFILTVSVGILTYLGVRLIQDDLLKLLLLPVTAVILYIFLAYIFKRFELRELQELVNNFIKQIGRKNK